MDSVIIDTYLKSLKQVNTREVRRERTFPNVDKMFKIENEKRVALTEEEKKEQMYIVFFNFFNQHVKFGESFGPFYGIRKIEFFNNSTVEKLKSYADIYFDKLLNKIMNGEKSITDDKEYDLSHLKKLHSAFNKELPYEERNYRRANQKLAKKYPTNLVDRCVQVNLSFEYNDAQEVNVSI